MVKPKLEPGDKIKVFGDPLLKKINAGDIFTVDQIYEKQMGFFKPKIYRLQPEDGRRKEVNHEASDIDMELDTKESKERNKIVKISG